MAIPRLRAATRLFLVYAVLSAIPVVALGVVLDTTYRHQALANGLDRGQEQAAIIEEMAVSPALSGEDLSLGLSASELGRLSDATDLAVYKRSVLQLRLQDFSGRVVFADDGQVGGVVEPDSRQFTEALVGRSTAEVVRLDGRVAVRVLRPVFASSGRSTGVLELHLPYDRFLTAVDAQVRMAWTRLLVGLVLLYAVLAAISWSTTRSLRRHAAQSEHEATHDSLTGLPNRALFESRAQAACARATAQEPVAVVLVDLDRFKDVNDSLGHHAGDELLQTVARRLRAAVRSNDTVARLGGDEFGLVLTGITDEKAAVHLVELVRRQLGAELQLEGVSVSVEASMGVALCPAHGADVDTLLRRADNAMYRGKRGSRSVVVAHAGAGRPVLPVLALHAELRRALETTGLVLFYQRKVALGTGRTVGVEALVRWQHPERGGSGPAAFLPGVEQSDLIAPFTTGSCGRRCGTWSRGPRPAAVDRGGQRVGAQPGGARFRGRGDVAAP
jgi:diguanylate cyclase (GGDEF)-like protein